MEIICLLLILMFVISNILLRNKRKKILIEELDSDMISCVVKKFVKDFVENDLNRNNLEYIYHINNSVKYSNTYVEYINKIEKLCYNWVYTDNDYLLRELSTSKGSLENEIQLYLEYRMDTYLFDKINKCKEDNNISKWYNELENVVYIKSKYLDSLVIKLNELQAYKNTKEFVRILLSILCIVSMVGIGIFCGNFGFSIIAFGIALLMCILLKKLKLGFAKHALIYSINQVINNIKQQINDIIDPVSDITESIWGDYRNNLYLLLMKLVLQDLGLRNWKYTSYDKFVSVKSKAAVDNYNIKTFIKQFGIDSCSDCIDVIHAKVKYKEEILTFLYDNKFTNYRCYSRLYSVLKEKMNKLNTMDYLVYIEYVSPAGRSCHYGSVQFSEADLQKAIAESKEVKLSVAQINKQLLEEKKGTYFKTVNDIIMFANDSISSFNIENSETIDKQIGILFDKVIPEINKMKNRDSAEWDIIDTQINGVDTEIKKVVELYEKINDYYNSDDFRRICETCSNIMESQREFNEYIEEKVKTISELFGVTVSRNETVSDGNHIQQYKKTITPFSVEVSANVFASAENKPLQYVIKYFYADRRKHKKQLIELRLLIEELETLKEAKLIIDNYKRDYEQYIGDVPEFIMKYDESGFYKRLGFVYISESILNIEYRFSYTSNSGRVQRSFTVPLNEENIRQIIDLIQDKQTSATFSKEQRSLMTKKLRDSIKRRDNYTCQICGNSTYKEPNLLLEVDHKIPIAKGGCTVESNLQTLCWKCNRSKGSKLV